MKAKVKKPKIAKKPLCFDVIIVGGGMVGLSVAAGLSSAYKVAVVDSAELNEEFSEETSIRVSAITRSSENWLKYLNAWQQIPQQRLSPYQKMQVWDAQGNGQIEFNCQDIAQSNLGHIIENAVIQAALLRSLKPLIDADQIRIFSGIKAQRVLVDRDDVSLILKDETELTGQLLVAADGANSWLRKQLAFPTTTESYGQSAVVALIESSEHHQRTAWQRFLCSGPLAFLPMQQNNLHSIVWSVNQELVDELLDCDEAEFLSKLEQAIESKFGKLKLLSQRAAFPLIARHATSYIQHRTLLVGDAAHSIHPLAGQGVNLGFLDAKALVNVLTDGDIQQRDPGLKQQLRAYERQRKGHNHQVQKTMTAIKQGFASEQRGVVGLRNQGMNVVNKSIWIKKQLIKVALGLSR